MPRHSGGDPWRERAAGGVPGSHDPQTDVTHDDPLLTGKIAWAHIKEYPDYYTRLEQMETEAERDWAKRGRAGR